MNVFAYYRVSSWEQEDKTGLPRQQDVVAKFAAANQMAIVREFSEVQSGGVDFDDRIMLAAMLDEAKTIGAEAIVVERIDRLARDLMAQEVFLRSATTKGIKVFTADSGQDMTNTDDPSRVMFRQIMGALSQWEKAVIVKKLQDGRRRMAEKTGQPCGGPPRYGFHPDPKVRERQREVIRRIKQARADGFSHAQIAGSLRAAGFAPPNSEVWHRATVYKLSKVNLDNPPEGGTY